MPFSKYVVDHTKFDTLNAFDEIVEMRDDLRERIIMETHKSALLWSSENVLIERSLAKGYEIEYSDAFGKARPADDFVNNVLNRIWNPELAKGMRHGIRFGMYVVVYIENKNTQLPSAKYQPIVLEPDQYIIKFREDTNGRREYAAFSRDDPMKQSVIPQSRVMIFYDPEPDGAIVSPVQKCLLEISQLIELWENNGVIQHKNAFPTHHYYLDHQQQSLVPNKLPGTAIAAFESEYNLDANQRQQQQYEAGYTADFTTKLMSDILYNQRVIDQNNQSYGQSERYDALNRRFMMVAYENPTLPMAMQPSGVRLETGAPQAQFDPQFLEKVTKLERTVTAALGVPIELVNDPGKKFTNDFSLAMTKINSTVSFYQAKMEEHIVTLYLDLYYRGHMTRHEGIWNNVVNLQKLDQENKKRKSSNKKTSESKRKKTDNADTTTPSDDASKPKEKKKTSKETPDEDPEHNKPEDVPDFEGASVIDSRAIEMLANQMSVSVQFASNPLLPYEGIKSLHQDGLITRETFGKLALNAYQIPESFLATPEEIENEKLKEFEFELKKQKLAEKLGLRPQMQPKAPPKKSTPPPNTQAKKVPLQQQSIKESPAPKVPQPT